MARSNRNLTDIFQDTADAIRAKTGGSASINPRDFADEIETISTGSSEIIPGPNDNVIVYDYDGTVLDAKQVAVGQEYTLPEAPSHDGLTFEEWVATSPISNGKITIPATKEVRVGALYHTTSGHIEIDVHAPKNIPITLHSSWTNVDWGDGTITTSSNTHTYANEGDYTIKVLTNVTGLTSSSFGSSSEKYLIKAIRLPNTITSAENNAFSLATLLSVNLPRSITYFGNNVFNSCYNLRSVVIPKNIAEMGYSVFISCYNLRSVVFGSILGTSMFQSCVLENIVISNGITEIPNSAFSTLRSVLKVSFPSSIVSIGISAFLIMPNCCVFDFSNHQSIPTIQSNSFSNININAKIIVPDALYNDWIAASNWSNLASQIVKASEA